MIWTERAQADLDEIWTYSREQWGVEQADRHLSGINAAIGNARNRKLRARAIDFVSPGLFRMRQVRHFIYFREVEDGIRVLRVLHDSMDETLHLP